MSTQLFKNARLVFPAERIAAGSLLVLDGKIAALDLHEIPTDTVTVDCRGRLLTPGLIDLHTHGIQKFRYDYDTSPEDFAAAARVLGQYGTTCVFPTLVPRDEPNLVANLRRLPKALPFNEHNEGAWMPGVHLEGPFVALGGAACATMAGDLQLLDDLLAACDHRVAMMSISPDQKDILPVIERLCERGVVPFITHTRASVEQTQAAIEAGAVHATHFYDVFPVPEETEPGVRPVGAVETILADRRVSVDFICDGVHVHPMAIRAAVAAKGPQGVILITDSNIGAGLPPGEYDTPWGFKVRVRTGDAARHVSENFLAGSALTMDVGMKNLFRWLELPPEQIWAIGTLNPARVMGLKNKGRLAVGADADLVLWDDDLLPVTTWVGGRMIYQREVNE